MLNPRGTAQQSANSHTKDCRWKRYRRRLFERRLRGFLLRLNAGRWANALQKKGFISWSGEVGLQDAALDAHPLKGIGIVKKKVLRRWSKLNRWARFAQSTDASKERIYTLGGATYLIQSLYNLIRMSQYVERPALF
ncbi:hypothetical protein [Allocoleopsis sp.]|uniref:hypothetical protein n=1 Tax=Allocoleopsis sp. TaxID=3088169 RepID=UPI002FD3F4E2